MKNTPFKENVADAVCLKTCPFDTFWTLGVARYVASTPPPPPPGYTSYHSCRHLVSLCQRLDLLSIHTNLVKSHVHASLFIWKVYSLRANKIKKGEKTGKAPLPTTVAPFLWLQAISGSQSVDRAVSPGQRSSREPCYTSRNYRKSSQRFTIPLIDLLACEGGVREVDYAGGLGNIYMM